MSATHAAAETGIAGLGCSGEECNGSGIAMKCQEPAACSCIADEPVEAVVRPDVDSCSQWTKRERGGESSETPAYSARRRPHRK